MLKKLKLQFDPNQEYQLSAINTVVDLFEGLSFSKKSSINLGEITPNILPDEVLYESALLDNLHVMQQRNNIPENTDLVCDDGMVLEEAGNESWRFPSFTIEMETGTGKTYVYLRTIYELNAKYGFTKFIVIVPSIAIYEGIIKTEEITRDHFRSLYSNGTINLIPYDGSRISRIRIFATSTVAQVMVMTVDAFNKITNNLYKASEKLPGELKPYQYVQQTRPILILDEPQSIDTTEKAKSAIRTLHPLFALRYSATHKVSPNLIYRLTPLQAYQQNLVKKIQVVGLSEQGSLNEKFLALESVTTKPITAKIKAYVEEKGIPKEASFTIKHGENLYEKTRKEEHKHGYIVKEINVTKNQEYLLFENEVKLLLGKTIAPSRPEVFRAQIEETVRQHMEVQEKLKPLGIKILSLFFVDKVANYISEDGLIRCLFDEAFEKLKSKYQHFTNYSASQVRQAYFAKTKTKTGEEIAINTEGKNKEEKDAERAAFALIMKEKEKLLSFEEPVSFIFAHSALKEGWDNPNVFQICTLNQTISEIKKRQEIGRGLRLCVNQMGERVFDDDVNILTVIANESYESYASSLQNEYLEEFGEDGTPPKPKRAKTNEANRNNDLFNSLDFQRFWQKLNQKTKYKININTPNLITECVKSIESATFPEAKIILTKGKFVITEFTIKLESVKGETAIIVVEIKDSDGRNEVRKLPPVKKNTDLAKALKDERLRNYKIQEISGDGDNACVRFTNEDDITLYKVVNFQSEQGQKAESHNVLEINHSYPVFNLIERASQAIGLTRKTLNKIFQNLSEETKLRLIKNPEGFASVFISNTKECLADHISKNIEFFIEDGFLYDVDALFPPKKPFPQKELEEAGEKGLYDKVQYDSEIERKFIERKLKGESDNIVLYFKFPPAFKLELPRIIGNYNPDWGIIRESEDGKFKLELVRETKGRTDIKNLQYSNERRKIECAEKHFGKLGIDYRYITGDEIRWWAKKGTPDEDVLDGIYKE